MYWNGQRAPRPCRPPAVPAGGPGPASNRWSRDSPFDRRGVGDGRGARRDRRLARPPRHRRRRGVLRRRRRGRRRRNDHPVNPGRRLAHAGQHPGGVQHPRHPLRQVQRAGETIAIIDSGNDPNIASDLNVFDKQYGLPGANLTVLNEYGQTTNLPPTSNSSSNQDAILETSMDVEWAHAAAPGAHILLVEANLMEQPR